MLSSFSHEWNRYKKWSGYYNKNIVNKNRNKNRRNFYDRYLWKFNNKWRLDLSRSTDFKQSYYFNKLSFQLSNKKFSFGINMDDIFSILDDSFIHKLRSNVIILFGQIFFSSFHQTSWFKKFIKRSIAKYVDDYGSYDDVVMNHFVFGRNPHWNDYDFTNCYIENRIEPLVAGFLNLFWLKNKKAALILVKGLSLFFEKFRNIYDFNFLVNNIVFRIFIYSMSRVFFFVKNSVNLFWGKYDKYQYLKDEFPLIFLSRVIPANILNLSHVFLSKLSYGVKRRFRSLFWDFKDVFKLLFPFKTPFKALDDSHFFFKIFFFAPFLLKQENEKSLRSFISYYVSKNEKMKNPVFFFSRNLSFFGVKRKFSNIISNGKVTRLLFPYFVSFQDKCFQSLNIVSLFSRNIFFSDVAPFFVVRKFFFRRRHFNFLKLNYFLLKIFKISSFVFFFFFWGIKLLDEFFKYHNLFVYFWWLKHYYCYCYFMVNNLIVFDSFFFFKNVIFFTSNDFFIFNRLSLYHKLLNFIWYFNMRVNKMLRLRLYASIHRVPRWKNAIRTRPLVSSFKFNR